MSVSISYFFNSDEPLAELAAEINAVVGGSLQPSVGLPEEAYTAFPFFGMEFSLSVYPIVFSPLAASRSTATICSSLNCPAFMFLLLTVYYVRLRNLLDQI